MVGITITPGFLRTARIPLLRGRDFAPSDNEGAPRVAMIDEEGARLWFPNQDPIGRSLRALDKPGEPPKWATIVGVVEARRIRQFEEARVPRGLFSVFPKLASIHGSIAADQNRSEGFREPGAPDCALSEQGPADPSNRDDE